MECLKGRVAIITGAGSGMGEAIAKLYAEKHIKVVVADLNEDSVKRVVSDIEKISPCVLGVKTDVSKQEDLKILVDKTIEKFGTVDILINNAGILDNFMTVGDFNVDTWDRVMNVNVKAPAMLSQLCINYWLKEKKPGVIINTASVGGMFGARGGVSYVASKHAVIGLTKNIASVYREDNIRAVAVAPGGVNTNIGNTLKNPDMKGIGALNKYVAEGPMGDPRDVANVVVFLASDEAKFVNGTVVTVDGGWTGA
ncbi:SDR family oxidoreductase [Paludibacter sp. 221]|uniref:glucose 1-dehydrogenase n=1 Tax=Paludibacter sp. 221 TaxID=2302939 RepID=UPI0013D36AC1|nr:glucose 1-dehydrogenase [Paludibacter sp. 221]NDV47288.1 SDR family oxidoreductase [Paludibacter sp. 221]